MTQVETAVLTLQQEQADVYRLTLDSPRHEPAWDEVVARVAQHVFGGRDLCMITYDPPLWDVELAKLTPQITITQAGRETFALGYVTAATATLLRAAVASTDFQLDALWLVAIPPTALARQQEFLATLHLKTPLVRPQSSEEFLECIDNKWLYWSNPQLAALAQAIVLLRAFAARQGWRFAMQPRGQ
ncbi:MAG: hypothetical protein R3C14_23625 [Caldilineaceae bacterium]